MSTHKIFISYSHKDEQWKDRVESHLGVLARQGLLEFWSDRKISVGDDWFTSIENEINQADAALLLISVDFLNSDFILNQEISRLLERRKNDGLRVIPLIVRACAWKRIPWLSSLQARPKDGRPLSSGTEYQIDADLASLAEEIETLLNG
jgi:hypothetical protein